jgi:hypothetical protein
LSSASIYKTFEKVIKELEKELQDADLHPILRANYRGVKNECEALVDAIMQIGVEEIAASTGVVNEKIEARFADPEDDVDPMEPHVFPKEAAEEDAKPAKK